LTIRKPEGLSKGAARVTKEDYKKFIESVVNELDDKGILQFILEHPENVVNLDETSFELNAMPDKVLTTKDIPHTLRINSAKHHENVTVTASIRANGTMLSPQIIFKEPFTKGLQVAFAAGGFLN
jgi:hypothetical protein